jgi:vancomycin resistance protein YoaR
VAEAVARVPDSLFGGERIDDPSALAPAESEPRFHVALRLGNSLAIGLTALLLLTAVGLLAVRLLYNGQVLPSVYVEDVPVGGLSRDEAYALVDQRANSILNETFVFDYDGRQWTTTLAGLGLHVDVRGSVDAAYAVGRERQASDRLDSAIEVARGETVVPLNISFDESKIDAWVTGVTNQIDRRARDASIVVVDGEISVTKDVDGIVVDQRRLTAILQNSLAKLEPYRGPLPVTFSPASIRKSDLDDAVAQLNGALSEPLTIRYKKKSWALQPADLGQFVITTPRTDGPGYTVTLDDVALGQWLLQLAGPRINREPVDATVEWSERKKKVVAASKSSIGVKMLAGPLADEVTKSFLGDHHDVEIPVRGLKPEIDSDHLDKLGITTRISTGSSAFYGSDENRATNIWVGTGYLNGTLVRPGATFSFNDAIGDITAEAGYVEASVVDGERIGKDVGGGICQVSTTVFRAAFLGGFPIGEWWPHLYRLAFYEYDGWTPGLDASILQEGPRSDWGDFTFVNPTDSYLLIEAYVQDQTDVVKIYGPETGWTVTVSEPWEGRKILGDDEPDVETVDPELPEGTVTQTEYRQDGLEISYQRIVKDANGNVIDDWIAYSKFEARGDVWKVSTDMAGQSPATLNPHKVGSNSDDNEE